MIRLEHIYKDYLQESLTVSVLKDINLTIEEGEYVAIMGPSGSGKTTLMNIVGCLDHPTSGGYRLDGEDVFLLKENERSDLRLNKIGFVFQNFYLMAQETALENTALPLGYANVPKQERLQRATEMLCKVGLEERLGFKPTQLSGGQKQRVAIARAMVNHPKVLLADEPTGALDSKSGQQIMELFEQLNREGVTVVVITHDANVAARAHRIIHIMDGEIKEPLGEEKTHGDGQEKEENR